MASRSAFSASGPLELEAYAGMSVIGVPALGEAAVFSDCDAIFAIALSTAGWQTRMRPAA
jgi:hypothetical protein